MDALANSNIHESYAGLEGRELLEPLIRDFGGKLVVVSSFGAESAVLLHMVSEVDKSTPIILLDTGKLFWETLSYRSMLIDALGLTDVRSIQPDPADLAATDPHDTLNATNGDLCCHIRKTIPLEKALRGFDVIVSGRKRYHGGERRNLTPLSLDATRIRAEPLAGFSALDIELYMATHKLPRHPLTEIGYYSIGCEPCTVQGGSAANPRAGRWAGSSKTECGIHWTQNGRAFEVTAAK